MAFICQQCNNRSFISQLALDQHTQSSAHRAKFGCLSCAKRFTTAAGLDAHSKVVHDKSKPSTPALAPAKTVEERKEIAKPAVQIAAQPTVQPTIQSTAQPTVQTKVQPADPNITYCSCGVRVYSSAMMLHFKFSPNHPNCISCGNGFETRMLHDAHVLASHPDCSCIPCQIAFASKTDRDQHYHESKAHPSCPICLVGFEDEPCYHDHLLTVHPRSPTPTPIDPAVPFLFPPPSPKSYYYTTYGLPEHPPTNPRVSSEYVSASRRSSHYSPSVHSARALQESRPQTPQSETGKSQRDEREATPPSYSRASSEPPPTLPHIRTSELFPQPLVEPEAPLLSAATDRATIITQASAPTSSVRTSQSISYASDATPDLTIDSSYSVISPESQNEADVASPVTAIASIIPPTRSPTPSVRSSRVSVNATVSRPPSRRQSTPRVIQASLPPPSVPITPLEPMANASMAVAAPVTPRGSPSSAGKTSSASSESSVTHSSRSKSSRTKVTSGVSGIPLGSTNGKKTHYDPKNSSATISINSRVPEKELNWHCRICLKDPSEPTVTMCGHLFCHSCIIQELARGLACPVCKRVMLLRLQLGATEKVAF
ncbi:hypothetical protein QCA50_013353 [Cerrena zonata]|uniref:RING-type E3 ubiquitin transferase n=1 Tax=Cerrena zonata TaxID=2478898 RepID=A0AAW0FVW2_9APHY